MSLRSLSSFLADARSAGVAFFRHFRSVSVTSQRHRRVGKKATRWQEIRELKEIKVGETKIVLCHYALRTWNGSHQGALQLYGQR